jgi:hypothetical protein
MPAGKRAGVRDPRSDSSVGRNRKSWPVRAGLSTVYDDLTMEDLQDAVRQLETG